MLNALADVCAFEGRVKTHDADIGLQRRYRSEMTAEAGSRIGDGCGDTGDLGAGKTQSSQRVPMPHRSDLRVARYNCRHCDPRRHKLPRRLCGARGLQLRDCSAIDHLPDIAVEVPRGVDKLRRLQSVSQADERALIVGIEHRMPATGPVRIGVFQTLSGNVANLQSQKIASQTRWWTRRCPI